MTAALKYIASWLEQQLPGVKIYLNWPGPGTKAVFPYLAVILVTSEIKRWNHQFLGSDRSPGSIKQFYSEGQWEAQVEFHYFAKRADREDQDAAINKISALFQKQFGDERVSSNLVLPYGAEHWEKLNLSLLDMRLVQEPSQIQAGERRAIFRLLLDVPLVAETELPLVTDARLDDRSEVGERADTSELAPEKPG